MQGASNPSTDVLPTPGINGYSMYTSGTAASTGTNPPAPMNNPPTLSIPNAQLSNNQKTNITSNAVTPMSSPFLVAKYPIPILPSAGLAVPAIPANNTVPEFLYQLTKMLTGGHKEVIEWSNGRIEVHNPLKLQNVVLSKYFRHSKFASFQRQLNYFGFRKIAGKGKMAPCSYVNDAVTSDIGSLLLIKRKTSATTPRDKNGRKPEEKTTVTRTAVNTLGNATVKPVEGGVPHQILPVVQESGSVVQPTSIGGVVADDPGKPPTSQFEIARTAVGKGVRHGYTIANPTEKPRGEASSAVDANTLSFPTGVEDSLSQLTDNFQNSLNEAKESEDANKKNSTTSLGRFTSSMEHFPGTLSRDSSLIELAMIAPVDDAASDENTSANPYSLHFVDFPNEETNPSNQENNFVD